MGIMKNGKYFLTAVLILNLLSVAFAGNTATTGISSALAQLCATSRMFLGMAIMLMILLAGATYAIGQVLGAETRARATVWATAMITGAIIGALIYIITPVIIQALLQSAVSC
jgi:hypothetical protein